MKIIIAERSRLSYGDSTMPMARTIVERLAPVLGLRPWTLEGIVRALRADGLVPMGERGRGKLVGHYEKAHLANVIMAHRGSQPSDATETVRLLRSLPSRWGTFSSATGQWPTYEPGNLFSPRDDVGQAIEHMISAAANLMEGRRQDNLSDADYSDQIKQIVPYEIRMSLTPLIVQMCWFGPNDNYSAPTTRVDNYFHYTERSAGAVNVTLFYREVIVAAAELLRENPSWEPTPPLLPPAPANATAGQKDESAGHPSHEVPTPSNEQPRANGAELSDQSRMNGSGGLMGLPEGICEKRISQAYADGEAGTSP